jgi:hypothetical protein
MRGFLKSDLKILKSSKFVHKITESQVVFSDNFKRLVLENPIEGMTRREMFNSLLNVDCFDKKFVDECLSRWRRKIKLDGDVTPKKRGRKKSLESMTIEELRAETAYQKEVIAHLKKLRGLGDDEL